MSSTIFCFIGFAVEQIRETLSLPSSENALELSALLFQREFYSSQFDYPEN
jgi:hypothetical protein